MIIISYWECIGMLYNVIRQQERLMIKEIRSNYPQIITHYNQQYVPQKLILGECTLTFVV